MRREVRIYPDLEALSWAAALDIAAFVRDTVARSSRCTVALAGGRTPRRLYELLAEESIPWESVHLFWGDERYVPQDDPQSNFRLVRTLLLDRIVIPQENVHPIPTHFEDPEEAAATYEGILREMLGSDPRFDLVLLGMGADGHVASLFPGSAALLESARWVVAVRTNVQPPVRITLTLPVINRACRVDLLVAGAEKRGALHRALHGPLDPMGCPGSAVRPQGGIVIWWVDRAAAEGVTLNGLYST
jgi:6-phosphogluconolactonase